MAKKLTKKQIESLAKEVRQFLLDHEMWSDVRIYFNGKAFSTDDGRGNYYYNDPENLVVLEDVDPSDYVEYTSDILTMTFEGPLYECLNYWFGKTEEEFRSIFRKYGLYYELGYAWSLAAFPL